MKTGKRPSIIVITGAESTGKSVLTRQLSAYFGMPSFAEYAREYVINLKRPYNYGDVISIALMQKAQMEMATTMKQNWIFFDTWLIITMIWLEVVYGKVPGWLPETIRKAPVDLYLVCDNDIPWLPDPVRENGGKMREYLEHRYLEVLDSNRLTHRLVTGNQEERLIHAVEFIHGI